MRNATDYFFIVLALLFIFFPCSDEAQEETTYSQNSKGESSLSVSFKSRLANADLPRIKKEIGKAKSYLFVGKTHEHLVRK